MRSATLSIRVFGIYLLVLGPLLVLVPSVVLGPFGIPVPAEPDFTVLRSDPRWVETLAKFPALPR